MTFLAWTLIALSAFAIFLIYGGFIIVLRFAVGLRRALGLPLGKTVWKPAPDADLPTVTVFIPALNEEGRIGPRMDNIAALDYPAHLIEIIVASDGSTDGTAREAGDWLKAHPEYSGQVKEYVENVGRATAQNWAAEAASGEIFVNTDVETRFNEDTLRFIVAPFQDDDVGAVGIQIDYRNIDDAGIGDMYARYRTIEYAMRLHETELSLCAKSDGPCTAVRRSLWTPIALFEDIDYAVPLVVRKAGYKLVYQQAALATDVANASPAQEVKQRKRMTIRQLTSFAFHWSFSETLRHPSFTAVFVCHKILRMLSPFFFMGLLLGYIILVGSTDSWLPAIVIPAAIAVLVVFAGPYIPPVSRISKVARSLLIANYAFFVGSVRAFMGEKVHGYRPTRSVAAPVSKDTK